MKAFISVDLEGMPYIVTLGHLGLKGSLFEEARKIATKITLTVAEELNKNGFNEIVVADSHGSMVNLLVDQLPEYIEIIRGFPRPTCMISQIEESDVACFLGYHAKSGTAKSTFDHTYSSATIHRVQVNEAEVSEFLLNAYAAGDVDVPVVLVAGEAQLLEDDIKQYSPWVETVILKHSLSSSAARSPSMPRIERELRDATRKAVENFKQNRVSSLTVKKPVKVTITFKHSHSADTADLLPTVKRIDGLTVEYIAESMIEGYKIFELLVLAATGTSLLRASYK
jgi:D-amino peptidase